MTREEAKDKIYSYVHMEEIDSVHEFMDILFDDIESRVCENCIHCNMDTAVYYCDTYDIVMINSDHTIKAVDEDFGCNKFERKVESK